MAIRNIIAVIFIACALSLGIIFLSHIEQPAGLVPYFQKAYYTQFGPLAICVELLIAGIELLLKRPGANFALALFAFTALLDPVFNAVGLFSTNVPVYGSVVFILCALPALWMAFANVFDLGRIRFLSACASFLLGVAVELFFNYW